MLRGSSLDHLTRLRYLFHMGTVFESWSKEKTIADGLAGLLALEHLELPSVNVRDVASWQASPLWRLPALRTLRLSLDLLEGSDDSAIKLAIANYNMARVQRGEPAVILFDRSVHLKSTPRKSTRHFPEPLLAVQRCAVLPSDCQIHADTFVRKFVYGFLA